MVNVLNFTLYSIPLRPKFCFLCCLKILCEMAVGVDPDQTALSGSALFAYAILSDTSVYEIFGHLPYIKHYQTMCRHIV